MNWRWIITVSLLAALAAGYSAFLRRDVTTSQNNEALEQPGYYLNDAIVTQSKADGSPGITLSAKRIEQQQLEDDITLLEVNLDYAQEGEQRWQLQAQRATVPPDSRIVRFTGNVELRPTSASGQASAQTYLRTESLTIDTEKNIAYNDKSPVDVRVGQNTLTTQHIEADLKNEKVRMRDIIGRSTSSPSREPRSRE